MSRLQENFNSFIDKKYMNESPAISKNVWETLNEACELDEWNIKDAFKKGKEKVAGAINGGKKSDFYLVLFLNEQNQWEVYETVHTEEEAEKLRDTIINKFKRPATINNPHIKKNQDEYVTEYYYVDNNGLSVMTRDPKKAILWVEDGKIVKDALYGTSDRANATARAEKEARLRKLQSVKGADDKTEGSLTRDSADKKLKDWKQYATKFFISLNMNPEAVNRYTYMGSILLYVLNLQYKNRRVEDNTMMQKLGGVKPQVERKELDHLLKILNDMHLIYRVKGGTFYVSPNFPKPYTLNDFNNWMEGSDDGQDVPNNPLEEPIGLQSPLDGSAPPQGVLTPQQILQNPPQSDNPGDNSFGGQQIPTGAQQPPTTQTPQALIADYIDADYTDVPETQQGLLNGANQPQLTSQSTNTNNNTLQNDKQLVVNNTAKNVADRSIPNNAGNSEKVQLAKKALQSLINSLYNNPNGITEELLLDSFGKQGILLDDSLLNYILNGAEQLGMYIKDLYGKLIPSKKLIRYIDSIINNQYTQNV